MNIKKMCEDYKTLYDDPEDVLAWVEHDLHHMGVIDEDFDKYMNEAKDYLEWNNEF